MFAIVVFLLGHWFLCVFCQTFFLHRYGAHSMFTMSKGWERFFHLLTFVAQGSSYLNPRAYAILHREHHAYSDTPKDPHSPHLYPNLFTMMRHTLTRYQALQPQHDRARGALRPAQRRSGRRSTASVAAGRRTWRSWRLYTGVLRRVRAALGVLPALPVHFLMGPIHGAIVNWCGHKYGYRNFDTTAERQVAQHARVRLRDHGRAVPEQPPQVRHVAEFRGALVRDRPDLSDHQGTGLAQDHRLGSGTAVGSLSGARR